MAQYQKFMFDNFVISCEDDKCTSQTLEDAETEELETDSEEQETEEIIETKAEEVEEEKAPSYTQEELDSAVTSAEERGYEKGFNAASDEKEKQQTELLENINNRLMTLLAEVDKKSQDIEQGALQFALDLVKKLFPSLEKQHAVAEVQKFLKDNFSAFSHEDSLSFSFNPEMIESIASKIGKLAEKNDFEGKISIHKNDNLGLSECRVEWKNGGVERSPENILNKVEALLDKQENTNKERDNGE